MSPTAAAAAAVACTADGLLRLLPLHTGGTSTPGFTSSGSGSGSGSATYAVALLAPDQPSQQLSQPWAALGLLPDGGGMLFAQRGSGRLLFCQPPQSLGPGQAAQIFQLGSHSAPITSIAISPCSSLALSGDAAGGLAVWGLGNGSQVAAVQGGSEGLTGSSIVAACWLHGDFGTAGAAAVATAQSGSSALHVWSCSAEGGLQLTGELDAGSSRGVTVLAAAGALLAVGCSDGSTQLWRHSSCGFAQQALLPAPSLPAAVLALSFSPDGARAAVATAGAAGPSAAVFSAAAGQLLCRQALPQTPAMLHWNAGGGGSEVLAVLEDGSLLGVEVPGGGASQQPAQWHPVAHVTEHCSDQVEGAHRQLPPQLSLLTQGQQGERDRQPGKKTVRFAADTEPAVSPRIPAAAAAPPGHTSLGQLRLEVELDGGVRSRVPQPTQCSTAGAMHDAAPACQSPGGNSRSFRAAEGRSALPPMPAHPLLQGCGSSGEVDHPPISSPTTAAPRGGSLPGRRSGSPSRSGSAPQPTSKAAGSSWVDSRGRQPLYPVLDLRALQSLRNAAGGTGSSPGKPAGPRPRAVPQAASSAACSQPPCLGTVGTAAVLGTAAAERAMAAAAPEAAAEAQQQPNPEERPQSPGKVSRLRCYACVTLEAAASSWDGASKGVSGSRPASPAKAALLAQLAVHAEEAAGPAAASMQPAPAEGAAASTCAAAGGSRPGSPLKLGVALTRAEQQWGEEQAPEVRPFTGA